MTWRPNCARCCGRPSSWPSARAELILRTLDDFEHARGPRAARGPPTRPVGADVNVVPIVEHVLRQGIERGASDIHIEPMGNRVRIRYRIDGELVHSTDLPQSLAPQLTSRIKVLCKADLAERRRHQDGRMSLHARAT